MLVVKWALALVANPTVVVDCVRVKVADRVTVTYRFVVREKAVEPPRILVDVRVNVRRSIGLSDELAHAPTWFRPRLAWNLVAVMGHVVWIQVVGTVKWIHTHPHQQ